MVSRIPVTGPVALPTIEPTADRRDLDGVRRPSVSVILPTYNRARFLSRAFEAIAAQSFHDWELIVVDDGSSDDTSEVVAELAGQIRQAVRYHYQENRGCEAARNSGLDLARGSYIAPADSDDLWLPHHLEDCVAALEANPDVDWVYGSARRVDLASGAVLTPSTFYVDGRPRPFLRLRTRASGRLRIIEDPATIECMILHGLYCGAQVSVIRNRVFESVRYPGRHRVGEDQTIVVQALAAGFRFGYLDDVHVIYQVHEDNLSATGSDVSTEKKINVIKELLKSYIFLINKCDLNARQNRALRRRISREYFWSLGYSLFWESGLYREALEMFRRAIRLWPLNPLYWKTYARVLLASKIRGGAIRAGGTLSGMPIEPAIEETPR